MVILSSLIVIDSSDPATLAGAGAAARIGAATVAGRATVAVAAT
jgi:hypothetical protein